ncbi:ABC transporter permease [Romboutsia weinsteinii]|uniref:ABC transporter permease n=1 Tax=Romboutsia weinsteinii TaxID=2020949 RepID=A0A371J8X6_9FIRM|nr:ABC transporter permease [Romboutsia weinsteinii]RDY29127.1 ABC transporter permease [Romboutsia weinsteinii]
MSIIFSSIKRCFRDKNNILSIIFVALFLPYLFSVMYSSQNEDFEVNMYIESSATSSISKSYVDFIKEFDKNNKNIKINYINKSQSDKSDLIVNIDDENKKISFKANESMNFGTVIIENITEEFFNQISIYEVASKVSTLPQEGENKYVKETSFKSEEPMDYKQYFSVTMLLMTTMTSSIIVFKNTFYLKEAIGRKVLSSSMPVSKLITLELLGSFICIFLQAMIIIVLDIILYDLQINLKNVIPIVVLMATFSLFTVSIGILVSSIVKKKSHGENIVSFITLIIMFSSGQITVDLEMSMESIIFNMNPVKWINEAMFALVEGNINVNISTAILMTLIYTVILGLVSVVFLKKKAVN